MNTLDSNNWGEEKAETPELELDFKMRKAKMHFEEGQFHEAWKDLFDLRGLAETAGRQDLVDEANEMLLQIAEKL